MYIADSEEYNKIVKPINKGLNSIQQCSPAEVTVLLRDTYNLYQLQAFD